MIKNDIYYLYNEYEKIVTSRNELEENFKLAQYEKTLLENQCKNLMNEANQDKQRIKKLEEEKKILQREKERLEKQLNNDGSNSCIPTSMTPIHKKKLIPNTRVKSGKKIGGQHGHKKHKLERFQDNEVTMVIEHTLEECSHCNSKELTQIGEIEKDVTDFKVVIEKQRHKYNEYQCDICGKKSRQEIKVSQKEENQYGPQVQALALTLMNQGNVAMNKVRKMITGFSSGELNLSEGFIAKIQKRASKKLEEFVEDLRKEVIQLPVVYWDDTVIMIDKKRSCLRYYGNENTALFKAHLRKNKEGLDDDNILKNLSKDTVVVHDHNKVNYNDDYIYQHAECNRHLLSDLQSIVDNLKHGWAKDLKKLLSTTNKERNELILKGVDSFSPDYLKMFFNQFDTIMVMSFIENDKDVHKYYSKEEKTLIKRILNHRNDYLAWVVNFDFPFTNNLSERSLRGVKAKQKTAGQFQNEKTASDYANIKTYIETCYRNGINEYDALLRLCFDKPFTVKEIFNNKKSA